MAEPFLSEIRLFGFDFAPRGWALCDGQVLPISQQQALYSLLGDTYGGNQATFALPDLRGRVPVGSSPDYARGLSAGTESVTLQTANLPVHTHSLRASSAAATAQSPEAAVLAEAPAGRKAYGEAENLVALSGNSVGSAGESQAHSNLQPTQVVSFCIAIVGNYPTRS